MWFLNLIIVLTAYSSVLGLQDDSLQLSLDYFQYRGVKFVCLFTCDRDYSRSEKYARQASNISIAVSNIRVDKLSGNYERVHKCLTQRLTSIGIFVDTYCPQFEKIIKVASQKMYFDATHKWLLIDSSNIKFSNISSNFNEKQYNNNITYGQLSFATNGNKNRELATSWNETGDFNNNNNETYSYAFWVVNRMNLSVDADITVSFKAGKSYDLYEVYNFGKVQGSSLNVKSVGSKKIGQNIEMTVDLNRYKYYRRWNFEGLKLRMIAVGQNNKTFDPEIVFGPRPTNAPEITRISGTIILTIAQLHNIDFVYTPAIVWIGSAQKLHSREVRAEMRNREQDLTLVLRYLANVPLTDEVDFLHPPVTSIETRYYYRITTTGPGKFENQFLRPLTKTAWYCVLATMSLCVLMLGATTRLERCPSSSQYAFFTVIASFCQQFFATGDHETTKVWSARRITVLVTGVCCLLVYNYYTSSVVSWLLNGPPPSINSLQELLESPLELIYEDIGYTKSWLQVPGYYFNKRNAKVEEEMKKKALHKKNGSPLIVKIERGIEMMKAGGYAFHGEVHTSNMLISREFTQEELCELGSLNSMEKTHLYSAVQKDSPYREFFVWSLARLKERGIISCIQRRTAAFPVNCGGSSPRALTLGGASPAFLLLAFGYFLAVIIMLGERWVYKKSLKCRGKY